MEKAKPASPAKPPVKGGVPASSKGSVSSFLSDDLSDQQVNDERMALTKRNGLIRLIQIQNVVILGLLLFLIFIVPIFGTTYLHYTLTPSKQVTPLVPLDGPLQTDEAIIFWAKTSITETMTFGFGDITQQINKQKHRFTEEGWELFLASLYSTDTLEAFRSRQLVLTTIPSDDGLIPKQGTTLDGGYYWTVQVPIIMNFTTNNNVSRPVKSVVTLKIIRVPTSVKPDGIAIQSWTMT